MNAIMFYRKHRIGLLAGLSFFLVLSIAVLLVENVQADNITVNSTIDQADANPGDGVCATSAGACTLRAAIQEANALPGTDTIQLPAGTYVLTIAPVNANLADSGDLDIPARWRSPAQGRG